MTVEQIEQFIKEAIPDATVEIEDLKGDGAVSYTHLTLPTIFAV